MSIETSSDLIGNQTSDLAACSVVPQITTVLRLCSSIKLKTNPVALVRKLTIPTERPPLVAEVSANFSG
jgi:hypothetical protein